jgi:hypothetical protein
MQGANFADTFNVPTLHSISIIGKTITNLPFSGKKSSYLKYIDEDMRTGTRFSNTKN